MIKSIIGWILATASLIIGVLIFFGVITFVPPEPVGVLLGGLGTGLGWLFGTALPRLGEIILDRLSRL
jgi:hypothetical protein